MMTAPTPRETHDWDLFVDWCASLGYPSLALPTTYAVISDFLIAFPAPIETQGRRVRAIRKAHERAQQPLELPADSRPTLFREGAEWAPVARALAQVPKYQHPKGFQSAIRGRRDGWLIVLVGIIGLSRSAARKLPPDDVRLLPRITIKGQTIPKDALASECPACAVTRWLRIAGDASLGMWSEVKRTVSPEGVDENAHDCGLGLDGSWRQANTLLPAVDRHGWVSSAPMSSRSISSTMAYRQALGPVATIAPQFLRVPLSGRYADATMNELAAAYDDVDQRAAALLLRLKEIVGEGDEMLDHLKVFEL